MRPEIRQFDTVEWPVQSARLIQDRINGILHDHEQCSVMLTGGRSAERLYTAWARLPSFQQMTGVRFFFGDERCVPPEHPESNYGMVMETLFARGVPTGCSVSRMEADGLDCGSAATLYDEMLPNQVDVLLLGVGEDGHIASLFPGSVALREISRRVVYITGHKPPYERITITPPVITNAKLVYLLATGEKKGNMLCKALNSLEDSMLLPVRLTLGCIWLLDNEAGDRVPTTLVPRVD